MLPSFAELLLAAFATVRRIFQADADCKDVLSEIAFCSGYESRDISSGRIYNRFITMCNCTAFITKFREVDILMSNVRDG